MLNSRCVFSLDLQIGWWCVLNGRCVFSLYLQIGWWCVLHAAADGWPVQTPVLHMQLNLVLSAANPSLYQHSTWSSVLLTQPSPALYLGTLPTPVNKTYAGEFRV